MSEDDHVQYPCTIEVDGTAFVVDRTDDGQFSYATEGGRGFTSRPSDPTFRYERQHHVESIRAFLAATE